MNGQVHQIQLELGVERWYRPAELLYGPGHGLLLQILRSVSPEASAALHDANVRKPFALSPLTVQPLSSGIAQVFMSVKVWDADLASVLQQALSAALDIRVTVSGAPAVVLNVVVEPAVSLASLVPACAPPSVRVHFDSVTFFSLGRRFGRQQYGLLPSSELVVYSWLRAWQSAGGTVRAPLDVGALKERVALRGVHALSTQVVRGEKTALTGFTGGATYAWVGDEPWGGSLLAALARFSEYCGTGAKTGHGFGSTRLEADRRDSKGMF